MLGNKYTINLTIEDEEKELYFNYQFLKNLYGLTQINPFYYIQDFVSAKDKYDYLGTIIYCMCNGDISLSNINLLLEDKDIKTNLIIKLICIFNIELVSECKEENENESDNYNEVVEKSEDDKNKEFENYWNSCYFTATILLKKTEDEFYKMSVRELQTLAKYNKEFYKNVLIDTYVTVLNAKNGNTKNNKKEEVINVGRLSDMFH